MITRLGRWKMRTDCRTLAHPWLGLLGIMLYLTPASAGALSLGELEVQSRLNAPLQAIIPLSANAAELADVEVGLGTEAAFQRAGIEHDELLYSLRFAVVKHGDVAHILLTSTNGHL